MHLDWPVNLRPMLAGSTNITVVKAATEDVVARGTVSFDHSATRTAVVDRRGRWLAINKWGNLGVPLESQKKGARERLLNRAHRLIEDLSGLGFRPFLSSGSLLGAIRNGRFLPHDDDIDLGNVTDTQHPADLVIESERIERALAGLGYTVVRHTHAHLQIVFLHKEGDLDHYIDIFTAYFDPDGTFNQPFSIRGELPREALEPFVGIELEGNSYPSPAVPEKWLELNYGRGWRTPDPGFQFGIPEDTRRRFDSWFGSFNLHRDFWEARHGGAAITDSRDCAFVLETLATTPANSVVVDIGAGTSRTAQRVHDSGRSAIVADFSLPALFAQAAVEGARQGDAVYLNLNDRHRVLEFALERIADGRQTSLVFEHVLEGLDGDGRENAVLLMHWILSGTAVAAVTFDTDLPDDHAFEDPTSWHLPVDEFIAMTNAHDLAAETVRTVVSPDDRGRTRVTAHVIVRRQEGATR
ncbi:hypothetical protein GCM10027415_07600 [Humibacter ginsengisoli]